MAVYTAGAGLIKTGTTFSIPTGGVTSSMLALPLALTGSCSGGILSAINTGNGCGVYANGTGYGVYASPGDFGVGVYASSSGNIGVYGDTGSTTGRRSKATTTPRARAVFWRAWTRSTAFPPESSAMPARLRLVTALYGTSTGGYGVFGTGNVAVEGISSSSGGYGVYGRGNVGVQGFNSAGNAGGSLGGLDPVNSLRRASSADTTPAAATGCMGMPKSATGSEASVTRASAFTVRAIRARPAISWATSMSRAA